MIPPSMNQTAEYMARFGMKNVSVFSEAPGIFGNIQHFLDRDMGLAIPVEIYPNFGFGNIEEGVPEVIQEQVPVFQEVVNEDHWPLNLQM